jgi:hypothetical protein
VIADQGGQAQILLLPCRNGPVLQLDGNHLEVATNIDVEGGNDARFSTQWRGGVFSPLNRCIYMMPYHHTQILKLASEFSSSTNGMLLDTPGTKYGGLNYASGALGADGCVYAIPLNAKAVLKIDPRSDSVTSIDLCALDRFEGSYKWQGGVLADDGNIYCSPHLHNRILRINTQRNDEESEASSMLSVPSVALVGPKIDTSIAGACLGLKYCGAVLANKKVYFLPSQAMRVAEYCPETETFHSFGDTAGGGNWAGGALAADGKIYCVPSSACRVLRIDPVQHTTSFCAKTTNAPSKWLGCAWDPHGSRVVCAPEYAQQLLVVEVKVGKGEAKPKCAKLYPPPAAIETTGAGETGQGAGRSRTAELVVRSPGTAAGTSTGATRAIDTAARAPGAAAVSASAPNLSIQIPQLRTAVARTVVNQHGNDTSRTCCSLEECNPLIVYEHQTQQSQSLIMPGERISRLEGKLDRVLLLLQEVQSAVHVLQRSVPITAGAHQTNTTQHNEMGLGSSKAQPEGTTSATNKQHR